MLVPEYHPMLRNPSREEVEAICSTEEGRANYARFLAARQKRIDQADEEKGDPYRYGWALPHWSKADQWLKRRPMGQFVPGGKRATKSERAAWRTAKALTKFHGTRIWALQGAGKTARAEQHALIYKYLAAEYKALNGRARKGWAKIDYVLDRGFANDVLVLPNKSELYFLTYSMDPKEYQGWELGKKLSREEEDMIREDPELFNIGAWADEDMPLAWFDTMEMRCATFGASWLWTFSTMNGITPTIRAVLGTPETVESAPAELLSQAQSHVDGLPPGHMPIVQLGRTKPISIVYFWTEFNPFPPNYQNVRAILEGKPAARIKQDAYGYATDVQGRAFPKFGSVHIVKTTALPAQGTNYMLTEPGGGARMWATIWVRVTPGNPSTLYIYRDWPDVPGYGDWAEPDPQNTKPDGVRGPAQRGQGIGYTELRQTWRELEAVKIPSALKSTERRKQLPADEIENLIRQEADPHRQQLLRNAIASGSVDDPSENIEQRFIDPRAANSPHLEADTETTPLQSLLKDEINPKTGQVVVTGMEFDLAPGLTIVSGLMEVTELLNWDANKPYCAITNEPRLYVAENCLQVINCLSVYTGLGGEKGGWKDFADLLRYMATAGLEYVDPSLKRYSKPRGGY